MNDASNIGLYYDSWDTTFKEPFGAIKYGTTICFRLSYEIPHLEKIERIDMEIIHENERFFVNLSRNHDFFYTYQTFEKPGIYFYKFVVYYEGKRYYLAPDYFNEGGKALIFEKEDVQSYQLTVHSDIEKVPNYYSEGVIYQIFVDRFYNSNSNGMPLCYRKNSFMYANWQDSPFYIKDSNGGIERWDFFGGNLRGIISKLDYLEELGVTCIYLNPIFEARSSHKYDTANYMKIDPLYGDEEDLKELIDISGKKGIAIILDGVFSHTGSDSIYFNKYATYDTLGAYQSKDSPYYSWYKFTNYPHDYESWWGIGDLPNVNEMEPSYLEFITGENGVIAKWMKLGIKGFRLDVADELPEQFIRAIRHRIKKIDPQGVLLGEVWEDATNKIAYGERRAYLLGDSLDSVTAYPYRRVLINFLNQEITSSQFYNACMTFRENYPEEYYKSALKLIGSHDVKRIMTELGSVEKVKMAATLQLLFLGAVHIYYGDEVGLEGGSDPENRSTYPWENYCHLGICYDLKDNNPRNKKELLEHYKKLLKIRKEEDAIRKGSVEYIKISNNIIGYKRMLGEQEIMVIVNRADNEEVFTLEVTGEVYQSLFTFEEYHHIGEKIEIAIKGKDSLVIKKII